MTDLRVPKRRVPVQVFFTTGSPPLSVHLFLAEYASQHAGAERVEDLLNGPQAFLPAFDVVANATTLLNRDAVVVARMTREVTDDLPDFDTVAPAEHVQSVEVVLRDGNRLLGRVRYVRPEGQDRLSDVLNEPDPFLAVETDDSLAFVRKKHVARVVLAR